MTAWFYDTWGFIALANARDADHEIAAEADREREERGLVAVTTDYVLDETLTGLQAAAGPGVALRFLDLFEARTLARDTLLVEITSSRRSGALQRFRRLAPDVERLSLTDCASFEVMEELGIHQAFTADGRFLRAGAGIRPLFTLRDGGLVWDPGH